MVRIRKFLPHLAAAVAGVIFLGAPSAARADFRIYLQQDGVNGGAITQVGTGADFTAVAFTGTYGSFTVTLFGGSSSNAASLSDLLQSTTRVVNNTTSTATLNLYVSQTGYTLPDGTPLAIRSSLGGTITSGTLDLNGIFQAYADRNNNLLGMSDFTLGAQNATPSAIPGSFDTGPAIGLFDRGTGNYSLTSVATLELSGGGVANYSSTVAVTAVPVVPAPAGLVLAASGIPVVALGWLRRRKVSKSV